MDGGILEASLLPATLMNEPLGTLAQSQRPPEAVGRGSRPAANEIGLSPVDSLVITESPSSHSAGQLTGAEVGSRSREGACGLAAKLENGGWASTCVVLLCALRYTWGLQQHRAMDGGAQILANPLVACGQSPGTLLFPEQALQRMHKA